MEQQRSTWFDPTAIGMLAVALSVIPFSLLLLGVLPSQVMPAIVALLLTTGILSVIVGLISLARGDFAGIPMLLFGLLFMIQPAVSFMMNPGPPNQVTGIVNIIGGVILIPVAIVLGRMSWIPCVFIGLVGIGVILAGCAILGAPPILGLLSAILILLFGVHMLYTGIGLILAQGFGRPILPMGKPMIK